MLKLFSKTEIWFSKKNFQNLTFSKLVSQNFFYATSCQTKKICSTPNLRNNFFHPTQKLFYKKIIVKKLMTSYPLNPNPMLLYLWSGCVAMETNWPIRIYHVIWLWSVLEKVVCGAKGCQSGKHFRHFSFFLFRIMSASVSCSSCTSDSSLCACNICLFPSAAVPSSKCRFDYDDEFDNNLRLDSDNIWEVAGLVDSLLDPSTFTDLSTSVYPSVDSEAYDSGCGSSDTSSCASFDWTSDNSPIQSLDSSPIHSTNLLDDWSGDWASSGHSVTSLDVFLSGYHSLMTSSLNFFSTHTNPAVPALSNVVTSVVPNLSFSAFTPSRRLHALTKTVLSRVKAPKASSMKVPNATPKGALKAPKAISEVASPKPKGVRGRPRKHPLKEDSVSATNDDIKAPMVTPVVSVVQSVVTTALKSKSNFSERSLSVSHGETMEFQKFLKSSRFCEETQLESPFQSRLYF